MEGFPTAASPLLFRVGTLPLPVEDWEGVQGRHYRRHHRRHHRQGHSGSFGHLGGLARVGGIASKNNYVIWEVLFRLNN